VATGLIRVWKFFKLESPTPVQTPATIDPTEIYQSFFKEMTTQTPVMAEIQR